MSKKTPTEIWMERLLVVVSLCIAMYLSTALTENQFAEDVHELRQPAQTTAVDTAS